MDSDWMMVIVHAASPERLDYKSRVNDRVELKMELEMIRSVDGEYYIISGCED